MPVRVLLVDDVAEVRSLVRTALRLRGGFEVVGEAADGRTAVAVAATTRPDVVVLDLGLPDLTGGEVLPRLREHAPQAKVVVFTGTDVATDPMLLHGRVEALVLKDADVEVLVDLLVDLAAASGRHSASLALVRDVRSVARARDFVARRCEAWGHPELAEAARVIVSELVTNAVTHAATGCKVRLTLADAALRVEVVDGGGGTPDLSAAQEQDEHGRGLLLLSALAAAWGVETTPAGKSVWAHLPLLPQPRQAPESRVDPAGTT